MRSVIAITTALLVLAGGVAPVAAVGSADGAAAASATELTASAPSAAGGTAPVAPVGDRASIDDDNQSDENHPPDPPDDVLGWEEVDGQGVWYNETIAVDNSDGVNRTELDLLVARTMARVEYIRDLEFTGDIPVDIRSREAYAENVTGAYANISTKGSVHQNVKYEATFMVAEDQNAIDALASNRASTVAGYYDPTNDTIVIISDNTDTLQMDEFTLSHELAHAVQDQTFNITRSKFTGRTEDTNNAVSGIVEGDAHYTEKLYQQRCNNESHPWNGTCVRPTSSGGGGGGDFNVGIFLISFQPYSDGPVFVDQVREQGGWEAVNQIYESPPQSSEQVIHPEKYGSDPPTNVTVEDRSNDDWKVLDLGEGSVNYATFGEAGLFSMFWYPGYREGGRSSPVVQYDSLFSTSSEFDAYNYDYSGTNGWDGDKLYPYVPADASGDELSYNETGYVWKIVWDTDTDARQFVVSYKQLLSYYNAEPVDGRENTYVVADGNRFDDAYYVTQQGKTVYIVNAPSVEELPAVWEGAAPEETTTTTTEETTTTTTTEDGGETTTTEGDGEMTETTTETNQPGFGLGLGILAVLVGALVAARRIRD